MTLLRFDSMTLVCLVVFLGLQIIFPAHLQAKDRKNVILVIGDGMDDHQITIARNYLHGSDGALALDQMPFRGVVQVQTVNEDGSGDPVYVADSANSATAMATGVVTSRGRIATTAGTDRPIPTIAEMAKQAGFAVGVVTTSSITDATPASFIAHISQRHCHSPKSMVDYRYRGVLLADCPQYQKAKGGPGSLAEQIAVAGYDIVLGGGLGYFEELAEGEPEGGKTVLGLAIENGTRVIDSPEELASLDTSRPTIGLFDTGNLKVRLRGEDERIAEKPIKNWLSYLSDYLGKVELPEPMQCEPNPDFGDTPSLKSLTEVALRHLEGRSEAGFFLMVESASIDKQAHERKPCGSIGELQQLDEVVELAVNYAEQHADTLVMVTADHAQAAQLVPAQSLFANYPVSVYSPGHLARIETRSGAVMAVNYATNNFFYEEHTGAQVPIYSNRPGLLTPYMRQADIYGVSANFMRIPQAQE